MTKKQTLIFSDLDGTLLDHYDYSTTASEHTMRRLLASGIPIIPNTSKTFTELTYIRQSLDLSTPFIVENGAAICIPKQFLPMKPAGSIWQDGYWVKAFSSKLQYWTGLLKKMDSKFDGLFEPMSSMSIERICEVTGLSQEDAERASSRQYGEPVMWHGDSALKQDFIQSLENKGASPLVGGRFIHVCGDCNKGQALVWLAHEYKRQHKELEITTIALGDSNNDVAMLEVADIAVRIYSANHDAPQLVRTENMYTSTLEGPAGWSEILDQLIPPM